MTGRQDIFQQAMNQGHSAAWDQLWERASAFYRQALEEFPDHPKALTSLGLALIELQQFEESMVCYTRASRVLPEDPLPLEKIAQICERLGRLNDAIQASLRAADLYMKKNDLDRAIENWARVIRFNPENIQAYTRLAVTYEKQARKPEAVNAYLALAALVQHAGDMTKAVQAVNRALQILPESTEAQQALSQIRNNQMLPKPARPRGGTGPMLMAQVRQLGEGAQPKQLPGGGVFSDLDPVAEARQRSLIQLAEILFEQADEKPDENIPRRGLGNIMRGTGGLSVDHAERTRIALHLGQAIDSQTQGQDRQAAEELERAVEAGLGHPAAYFDLGLLRAQDELVDSALRYLGLSVKHPDYSLASRLLLGQMQRKAGNLGEAAVEYLEALKLADGMTVPIEQMDELQQLYEPLVETVRRETNQETLNTLCDNVRAQIFRPNWRDTLLRARQQLPAQSAGAPPLPLAEMLLQASSSQVIESIASVRLLASQGFLRTAVEEAYHALQYAPTYLPLHIQIGDLLLQDGRTQDGIDKFTMVSQIYNVRGEVVQAANLLRRIVQLAPMDLASRGRLIDLLVSRGQIDEAIREYMELAELYYRLAELDMARKTYMTAMRLTQQSSSTRAWSVQLLYKMGDIDMQRLDWRQALRVFEQIRTLQPDDDKARNNLIDLNFRLGQDTAALSELDSFTTYLDSIGQRERGIACLSDLVEERPENIDLRRRLADLYRRSGRMREAVAELDKVGDLLLSTGNRAGAAAIIQAILGLNPPNAAEYQRLLMQLQDPRSK